MIPHAAWSLSSTHGDEYYCSRGLRPRRDGRGAGCKWIAIINLRRLDEVWTASPIYFVTACTAGRARRLANDDFHAIAVEVWCNCQERYEWSIGRYVIMPDHVHVFVSGERGSRTLSEFVGKWKEWTAKYSRSRIGLASPLWQPEFFDHVLRSSENYEEKWNYVRDNPIRAGPVPSADEWKYQGEITPLRYD